MYCALGGHQHADLPETDLLTGVSLLDFCIDSAAWNWRRKKAGLITEPGFLLDRLLRAEQRTDAWILEQSGQGITEDVADQLGVGFLVR